MPRINAAGGANDSGGKPVAPKSTVNDEASDPNVTAQAWPMDGITTAANGVRPRPTSNGATIATGTPKPPTPCKNEVKTQPNNMTCIRESPVKRVNQSALEWLACPACKNPLALTTAESIADDVREGTLSCMLCGVFYPISSLPGVLQSVLQALPLSHAVALMRPLAAGQPLTDVSLHLGVLAAYAVLGY